MLLFGVISDVNFNKVVGYKMYDDVDDSYNVWHHQLFLEMYKQSPTWVNDDRSDYGYYIDL